jgi:DNA-binding Xre family transcriptional regulator
MDAIGISSFRALAQTAGVSEWSVRQLRRGKAEQLRGEVLQRLSHRLNCAIATLLSEFSETTVPELTETQPTPSPQAIVEPASVPQVQPVQQVQQMAIQQIETWLLQWPTAVYAAQNNPDLPASRLIPLVRPIEQLMEQWGLSQIAAVGTEVAYDPQQHQLMDGTAQPGDRVRVRYTGYQQGDRLLFRAKVSPG